jgi:hypothetical protein
LCPAVEVGFVTQVLRVHEHHAAAGDGGGGGILEVPDLEQQLHVLLQARRGEEVSIDMRREARAVL